MTHEGLCFYCQFFKELKLEHTHEEQIALLKQHILQAQVLVATGAHYKWAVCDVKPRRALQDLEAELRERENHGNTTQEIETQGREYGKNQTETCIPQDYAPSTIR